MAFDRWHFLYFNKTNKNASKSLLRLRVCFQPLLDVEAEDKAVFMTNGDFLTPSFLLSHRRSLSKDAKFFDSDTGVLEVPMTVQVAGQVCVMLRTIHVYCR